MPKVTLQIYGFVKGILDNTLSNRNDLDIYRYAGLNFINYILRPQGPMSSRNGTKKIGTVSNIIKGFEFKFSDVQSYSFLMKDKAIDVYTANDNVYRATIISPFLASEVPSVKWTQSFDTLIMCHENHPPQKIVRGGSHSSWTISEFLFEDPPVDRFNVTAALKPSGTTGNITLTLSGTGSNYWQDGHVGRIIRTNEGAVEITSITSPTVANGTTTENLVNANEDLSWREEVGSSVHGYFRVPVFHANRLVLCGSRDLPQSIWVSKTADIDNFNAEDLKDDSGFVATLSSGRAEPILDAVVKGSGTDANLQIYTSSSEWVLQGEPLTPSTANAKVQTRIGTLPRPRPIEIESQVIFASSDSKSIYDFTYDFASNSFKNSNLTLLSPSVVQSPKDLAYIRNYSNTQSDLLWLLNENGTISVLTINKSREVLGWTRFETYGEVVCIFCAGNKMKLVTNRDSVQYFEEWVEEDILLDCYEKLTSAIPTKNWTGVTYLKNKEIIALVDGFPETIIINNDGEFETKFEALEVIVGYNYESEYESMPLITTINGQDTRGKRNRKIEAKINCQNTKDLWVDNKQVVLRTFGDFLLDQQLQSQELPVSVNLSGISGEPTIKIQRKLPLQQTIIGLTISIKVGM